MILNLTQPILNMVSNFDATEEHTFTYMYLGTERSTVNQVSIRPDEPNSSPVYTETRTSFDKVHIVPRNALRNGLSYLAKVRVQLDDGTWTEWSAEIEFMCLTRPNFYFEQIGNSKYVYTNEMMLSVLYAQEQSEKVETYQFILQDYNHVNIQEYPVRIPAADDPFRFSEHIKGLQKGRLYYAIVRVTTKHGMVWESQGKEFVPQYVIPTLNSVVQPELNEDEGQIQIHAFLKQILGTPAKPYIPNRATDSDYHYDYWSPSGQTDAHYVIIPKDNPLMFTRLGMAKASDFIAKLWCAGVDNGLFLQFSTKTDEKNPTGTGVQINFVKHDDYITMEKSFGRVKSRARSNVVQGLGQQPFYLYIKVTEYRVQMIIEKIGYGG